MKSECNQKFITIGLRDLIYCAIIGSVCFILNTQHVKSKNQIESRLKEVCFRYNDSCDLELGGCTCVVKASKYDVNFILNK